MDVDELHLIFMSDFSQVPQLPSLLDWCSGDLPLDHVLKHT